MRKDITGQRFGNLVAVKPTGERKNGHVIWECKCDCGKTSYARKSSLSSGSVNSCGCSRTIAKDIVGKKFGRLTVIGPTDKRQGTNVVWECRCDCGNITFVTSGSIKSGNTKSCGCSWKERGKDLTGMKFGYLTAIRPTDKREANYVIWKCRCDCGNTKFARAGSLTTGNTKSCGCLKDKKGSGISLT